MKLLFTEMGQLEGNLGEGLETSVWYTLSLRYQRLDMWHLGEKVGQ
jgi:hypothetical protein